MPDPSLLPDDLAPSQTAFFLDLDGTLAEIVADPARAAVRPATLDTLARLAAAADGALAVVSGRSIAQLDAMLRPLILPVAGVHGLERRDAFGSLHRAEIDPDAHRRLAVAVSAFVEGRRGLLAEVKPGSVALHFRKRPELEAECLAMAIALSRTDERIRLVEGKKVVELKLGGRTKGHAIADFMAEEPFHGRRPFFAGDDVTDEAGFSVVNGMGGVTVKIGPGRTIAQHRVAGTAIFARELAALL